MKKLSLILTLSLFVVSSAFATNKWIHEEYEEDDGGIRDIFTIWDKDSYKEFSIKMVIAKSPANEYAEIYFQGSDNVIIKYTQHIHVKFGDNPIENFKVNYWGLNEGYSFTDIRIVDSDTNKFLDKLGKAKKITVELDVEKYGKISGKFYTE